jgi:Outer membrane protein transport protein (OMPP1/FadL/TodX)
MKLKITITGVLSSLLISGYLFYARADNGNYQNYLVGDRAAGMGGAVAASTNDLDACYYNPAGLANVTGSRIALSVSLYGIYRIRVEDGLGPDQSYKSRAFESIPSTFGSILKVTDSLALAFSVFTPDEIDYNTQQSFEMQPYQPGIVRSDYYANTIDDSTTWIGPSLGFKAGERLSLGCGVYLVYRSVNASQDWTYLYTTQDGNEVVRVAARQYRYEYTDYSLLGMVGAQYLLTDNISLGLSIYTPTLHLSGDGSLFYGISLDDPDQDTLVSAKNMESNNKIPTKIILGAAYRQPGNFTVEADLSYHFPTSYTELQGKDNWSSEEIQLENEREPVVNLNLGGEYYVVEHYPLRAGFFTNLSSSPAVDPEVEGIGQEKIDMYGFSASVGNESEHTTINLGVNYVWGKGNTLGFDEDFKSVEVPSRESYLFVFLSSAYIF